jgi:hypothetical protein
MARPLMRISLSVLRPWPPVTNSAKRRRNERTNGFRSYLPLLRGKKHHRSRLSKR